MANEVTVTARLAVRKGNINRSEGGRFQADVSASVAKGPVPGALTVAVLGTDVSLAELGTPGWGRIENIDATYSLTAYAVLVSSGAEVPFCTLAPGESFVLRLPSGYGDGDATGTGGAATHKLRLKGVGGMSTAIVEFFEA